MSHERGAHKSWVSRICYAIGNLGQAAYYNALSTFFVTYYAAQTLFRDYEDSEAKAMIAIASPRSLSTRSWGTWSTTQPHAGAASSPGR